MKGNMERIERMEWDPVKYFTELTRKNKLCKEHKFKAVTCSGPENLEGLLSEYRRTSNFIVIDETSGNSVFNTKPGWQTRQDTTVWVLAGYSQNDMDDRKEKLEMCRRIFRQFLSRLIYDKDKCWHRIDEPNLEFLDLNSVLYKELGRYSFNGATGLYFMIANNLPTDLRYDEQAWEE